MEGICRFQLDEKISEEPLQINKIITIENFKILEGKYYVIQISAIIH